MQKIAIIGGSGLESLDLFRERGEVKVETAYGQPSSSFFRGIIYNREVYILSRHGRKHEIPPTQVNNPANIAAIKELGCSLIIATTACGSLRENIHPGDLVLPGQFIDFTRHRQVSFFKSFQNGDLKHTAMPDPFSEEAREALIRVAARLNIPVHPAGTVITVEGPRFSTRAESKMFRIWGADIVNMSTAPEVILANEAGIPYVAVAMCTDFDTWREGDREVSWKEILEVFNKNAEKVTVLLKEFIRDEL